MNVDQIVEFIQTAFYWFGVVVAAASVIVKATPTQADDAVLAKIIKVLDALSIFNPNGTETIKKKEAKPEAEATEASGEK